MTRSTVLIAHRGWSNRFPENSVPSIAAAIWAGADEVEIDLRASQDGVVFVLHDSSLGRVSTLSSLITDTHSDDVEAAHARDVDGSELIGLKLPTFREVFEQFGGQTTFNLHVKDTERTEAVLHELRACFESYGEARHYIASDAATLSLAREHLPRVPLCLVSDRTEPVAKLLETASELDCERIQFFYGNCGPDDVAAARRRGLLSNYYFADREAEARELISWGVDAILTNDIGPVRHQLFGRKRTTQ